MPRNGIYMVMALAAVNQLSYAAPVYTEEDVDLAGRSSSSIFEHGSLGSQNSIFDHTGSIICGPNSQTVGGICVPEGGSVVCGPDSTPSGGICVPNGGGSNPGSIQDPNSIVVPDSVAVDNGGSIPSGAVLGLPDSILTPAGPSGADSTADATLPSGGLDLSADGSSVDVPAPTAAPSSPFGGDRQAQTTSAARPTSSSTAKGSAPTQSGKPAAPKTGAAAPMATNAALMLGGVALAALGL